MNLIKGDCINELSKLDDKSVDFVYCDLPYGQTACKWDIKIDLAELWIQLKRIAKNDRTPFFFSCTTKFGFDLIGSNKSYFRWDLVWKKNRAAGFLNAYKLPMRKHEMVYCFAKKTPEYDVSSHKEYIEQDNKANRTNPYTKEGSKHKKEITAKLYKNPLPTSDITPPTPEHELVYCFAKKTPEYDLSSHKEYVEHKCNRIAPKCQLYGEDKTNTHKIFKNPLPTSDITPPTEEHELVYCFAKKSPEYDVSSHKDLIKTDKIRPCGKIKAEIYSKDGLLSDVGAKRHKDPLPTSDITPSSWCEFKNDEKTGHRTAKPVKLMEFLLKYWTKPDWVVLDPTMGSGSMGIACKNMGRKFIGIERDDDIFKLAQDRIKGLK
jgi:DNA modification methylase